MTEPQKLYKEGEQSDKPVATNPFAADNLVSEDIPVAVRQSDKSGPDSDEGDSLKATDQAGDGDAEVSYPFEVKGPFTIHYRFAD